MFQILPRSHDNVIGLEVEGTVTIEEVKEGEKVFEEALAKHDKISWVCVWKSTKYDSLDAFYEDMMWLLRHVKRFDRMAIVGDAWWKKLLVQADSLVFGEKYFDLSQLEEAWAYVEGK